MVNAALSLHVSHVVSIAPVQLLIRVSFVSILTEVFLELMAAIEVVKDTAELINTVATLATLDVLVVSHLEARVGWLEAAVWLKVRLMVREAELRLTVEARAWLLLDCNRGHCNGLTSLELLLSKQVLPVLVLALELLVCALEGGLLFLQLADLFLKNLHFLALLQTASHGRLTVLKSFSCLLVGAGVIGVVEVATAVDNLLLQVLLLLF